MKKGYLNWSGGKDSVICLHQLLYEKEYSIGMLLTTLNNSRVSLHNIRKRLIAAQAECLGLPVKFIDFDGFPDNEEYNLVMKEETEKLKQEGFEYSFFADLFLKDIRKYREKQMLGSGIKPVFPIWGIPSDQLINSFIDAGYQAITVSVDASVLDKSYCGRIIDREFVESLPEGVDPCGENGEFHTFVFDGPIFKNRIVFSRGDIFSRQFNTGTGNNDKEFWLCELIDK